MTVQAIRAAAIDVLLADTPSLKCSAAHRLLRLWATGKTTVSSNKKTVDIAVPNTPGRPLRPALVNPRDVKRRRLGSVEGRIALLHAIAHIEFNAINLAADMVARFAMNRRIADAVRADFITDWVSVCDDEARHFAMINTRLIEMGSKYGDLPAHNGLWDAALSTKNDLAARLVVAPMVLEARGLDVTPKMIQNLQKFGDDASATILTTILEEEIAHVAAGAHWFSHICKNEKRSESPYFRELLATHFKGSLKPPFNEKAREKAGLPRTFYDHQPC
ncbi:MAG: ferritin-like domain-containing protein [Hyphomonadaceae bacterium]|nr:ferritin-like domain-containing protein [Hyphomonadaceae bacterium]